jgi:penicillin amidase
MRRAFKWLGWLLIIIVILVVAAGAGGYAYLRASLPDVSGTVTAQGLDAPVEIIRDADAVPHIYAESKRDALFGLGYAHAQDRLWQLEFQRRIGQGRLSEMLGAATVETDRFLRTLGVYRASQSAWEQLAPEPKSHIEAYAAGINAFLSVHSGASLPPEFTLLGVKPEPWTGPDVIVWQKMMSWDLSGNYNMELLRNDLRAAVGDERAAQLLPGYPEDAPTIVPAQAQSYGALAQANDRVWDLLSSSGADRSWVGSNSWVVDGTKSTTGKPVLADDPHLGLRLPSTWYMAHMSAGDFDVIGATIPGLPAVVIGHNRSITWGVTNCPVDVQDLFQERLDDSGAQVEFQGAMEPLQIITETIKVKGGADVQQRVRITRHGPLISDAINDGAASSPDRADDPPLPPLALRWNALDATDTTIEAFLNINEAQNWDEFKEALRGYITPSQNFTYADVQGNIGYQVPGNVPQRAGGNGTLPAEGWSGANEWTGWIPFDQLPTSYNPPEHFIVTANNRPVADGYPFYLGSEWAAPYRAERITELLEAKPQLTPDEVGAIQGDTYAILARQLLPELFAIVSPETDQQRQAIELLKGWDGTSPRTSVPASIFAAWAVQLSGTIAADELGADLGQRYNNMYFMLDAVKDPENAWCDDVTTEERENCAAFVTGALQAGLTDLQTRLGPDMNSWQWQRLHVANFPHQPLDNVPQLRSIVSRRIANSGNLDTVNPGGFGKDFVQGGGPGYRQVVDLSALDSSRFIHAGGQSGHVLSSHYADYIADWADLRYRPLRFTREAVTSGQTATLRLEPAP